MIARRQTSRRLGAAAAAVLLAASMSAALVGPSADAAKPKVKPKAATGSVAFDCVLDPLGSEYAYPATVSVVGTKAKKNSTAAALVATISKQPGISPVPISGPMDVTLNVTVGGKAKALKGSIALNTESRAPIPMPKLKGKVKVAKTAKTLPIVVTGLTYELPSFSFSGSCTLPAPVTLTKMKLGY